MFLILLMVDREEDQLFLMRLYEENEKHMLRTARKILGQYQYTDDVEDAMQDAIETIIEQFHKNNKRIRDGDTGYIVTIVKSRAFDKIRKNALARGREVHVKVDEDGELVDLEIVDTSIPLAENVEEKDELGRLAVYIQMLAPIYRIVLEKKVVFELKNKEIAKELGISESTVSSRLQRAREQLREIIAEKEGEEVGY